MDSVAAYDTLTKTALGAMVVLLSIAVVALYRALIAEKDKRLADAQQQTTKLTDAFTKNAEVQEMFVEKIESAKRRERG